MDEDDVASNDVFQQFLTLIYNRFYQVGTYNDERFDRDIASVTSSLDVRPKSELWITYSKEELGGSIILNDT